MFQAGCVYLLEAVQLLLYFGEPKEVVGRALALVDVLRQFADHLYRFAQLGVLLRIRDRISAAMQILHGLSTNVSLTHVLCTRVLRVACCVLRVGV
jgi:hypothetical protein